MDPRLPDGLDSGTNMSLVGLARSALAGRTQTAGVTTSELHSGEILRMSITVEMAIGYLIGASYWSSLQSSTFGTQKIMTDSPLSSSLLLAISRHLRHASLWVLILKQLLYAKSSFPFSKKGKCFVMVDCLLVLRSDSLRDRMNRQNETIPPTLFVQLFSRFLLYYID